MSAGPRLARQMPGPRTDSEPPMSLHPQPIRHDWTINSRVTCHRQSNDVSLVATPDLEKRLYTHDIWSESLPTTETD